MKKLLNSLLALCIFLSSVLIPSNTTLACTFTSKTLTPHVLSTGNQSDLDKLSNYEINSNGMQLFPLKITENGCVEITMTARDTGYINVEVHKKSDGSDLPTYIGFPCTSDRNNQYTAYQYFNKGTYYLRFPQNYYHLNMRLYSSATRTLKHGNTFAAYCDYTVTDTFNYKATKTGYITLSQKRLIETAAPMSVSFYNEKNQKISDVVSDHEIATKIVFPVIKGKNYKIKIKTLSVDGQQYYQMKLNFAAFTEKSGFKKSKAVAVKMKTDKMGIVYAEDSTKTQDWYKVSNTKNQKLKLIYSGNVTSGSINLTIYNKQGKKLGTYYLMPTKGGSVTYNLRNEKKGSVIPKGTYYIKVTKSRKQTAGTYEFRIRP